MIQRTARITTGFLPKKVCSFLYFIMQGTEYILLRLKPVFDIFSRLIASRLGNIECHFPYSVLNGEDKLRVIFSIF